MTSKNSKSTAARVRDDLYVLLNDLRVGQGAAIHASLHSLATSVSRLRVAGWDPLALGPGASLSDLFYAMPQSEALEAAEAASELEQKAERNSLGDLEEDDREALSELGGELEVAIEQLLRVITEEAEHVERGPEG